MSSDLVIWVDARPDLFAGVWWDGVLGEYVFTATAPDQARTMIDQQFPGVPYRVDRVPRAASVLQALQQRILDLDVAAGSFLSSSRRVWDGRVQIDLGVLDTSTIAAVEREFADDLDAVCVTGVAADAVPSPGPQPRGGPDWRLLSDPINVGEPYDVDVALNNAEYQTLWDSLAQPGDRPAVDFDSEIVIAFTIGVVATCPASRLDSVITDMQRSLVTPEFVTVDGVPTCTAIGGDPQPHLYLVAFERNALPTPPFTVSLSGRVPAGDVDCSDCKQVTDLEP